MYLPSRPKSRECKWSNATVPPIRAQHSTGKFIEGQRQAWQSQSDVARLSMSFQAESTAQLGAVCREAQRNAQREGERADRERERADRERERADRERERADAERERAEEARKAYGAERERAEVARKAYDAERASFAAFREKQLAAQASAMAVRASGSSAETGGTSRITGTGGLPEETGSGRALSGSCGSPVMLRSEGTSGGPPPSRSHAPRGTGGCHPASSPRLLVNPRDGGFGTSRGDTREAVHSELYRREEAERPDHRTLARRARQAQEEEDEETLLTRRSQASRATFERMCQAVQHDLRMQGQESARRRGQRTTALHRQYLNWYHRAQRESQQGEHTVLV